MRIEGNLNALLGIHRLDQADTQRLAKTGESAPTQEVSKDEDSRASLRTQIRLFEASARVIQDSATTVKIVDRAMTSIDGKLAEMQDAAKSLPNEELTSNLQQMLEGITNLEKDLDTDGNLLPAMGRPDWTSQSIQDALKTGDRPEIMLTLSESRDQLAEARTWAGDARNTAIQNGLHFLDQHSAQVETGEQAQELASFTKIQILRQSGMALIAQAQIAPQVALGSLA
jgi:flagellin-like hook-associated protein FlgL